MSIISNLKKSAATRKEERLLNDPSVVQALNDCLNRNEPFFQNVINSFRPQNNTLTPWVMSQEQYRSNSLRTVFIGYEDLYVYNSSSIPTGPSDTPWPKEYYMIYGEGNTPSRALDHTRKTISYPDDFGYHPISDVEIPALSVVISRKQFLSLVASRIYDRFRDAYPHLSTGQLAFSVWSSESDEMYYYFTYEAPYKQLTKW